MWSLIHWTQKLLAVTVGFTSMSLAMRFGLCWMSHLCQWNQTSFKLMLTILPRIWGSPRPKTSYIQVSSLLSSIHFSKFTKIFQTSRNADPMLNMDSRNAWSQASPRNWPIDCRVLLHSPRHTCHPEHQPALTRTPLWSKARSLEKFSSTTPRTLIKTAAPWLVRGTPTLQWSNHSTELLWAQCYRKMARKLVP